MIFRHVRPDDAQAIDEVVSAAFGRRDEADLVRRLVEDDDCVFELVAEEDGKIVGHVLFSRMEGPFSALALAPVSVVPERQGAGIGSKLIRGAIATIQGEGWDAIFVLGDPAYYTRFGFNARLAEGFSSPYAGPHFMVLPLAPALPTNTGELFHAPAFSEG